MKMTAKSTPQSMQRRRHLFILSLVMCALRFANAPDCNAALIFDVTMNVSSLSDRQGPFYIDFQLNDGSGIGDANNTVMITKFPVSAAVGYPLPSSGYVDGNLSSSVQITDGAFVNEFTQQFEPRYTVSFRVNLTTNVDAGAAPDAFSFSILDRYLNALPTTENPFNVFLVVEINQAHPMIETFSGNYGGLQFSAPRFSIVTVPETGSSISILLIGIGAVWIFRRVLATRTRRCLPVGNDE